MDLETRGVAGLHVWAGGEPIDDVTLAQWELQFARRALALLKELITEQEMKALLAPLMARSKKLFDEWIAASNGQLRSFAVDIEIDGLSAARFAAWFQANTGGAAMLAAHRAFFFSATAI
ncbi:hypothetical protein [Fodinicola feengrottensis]|uniref:hypothetical protein n=1 Tax=Fodinicola feengrottensis TaxID=435914 RepID=UPI0013D69525|nr:hypothetical protein [Fodinicola feengrottensis]